MGYVLDAENDRARLEADGFGWSRYKYPLAAAQAGDNAMFVAYRFWLDEMDADTVHGEGGLAWSPALYCGLSFDGIHPANNDVNLDTEWNNFFGIAHYDGGSDDVIVNTRAYETAAKDFAFPCSYYNGNSTVGSGSVRFTDGNGTRQYIESMSSVLATFAGQPDSGEMILGIPRNPTIGQTATYCHYIYSEEGNEGVRSESWINLDSVDLEALALASVDIQNPKATFPISSGWTTGVKQLNDIAETGTNWRPSSGVMGLPSHFIARWPFGTVGKDLVIDKIISKTGQIYV